MRLDREPDLIAEMVRGLYDAENRLVLALPRVASRASNPELRAGLRDHVEETRGHAKRLEQVAAALGVDCGGKKCLAMEGLLKESEAAMGYGGSDVLVDAAIIAACQAVEHFEISQYRALSDLCAQAGEKEAADLVAMTLAEEQEASKKLSKVASELLHGVPSASIR